MDCVAIPAPAGQQRGGEAAEEQGSVLPAVSELEGGRQSLAAVGSHL